MVVTTAQRSQLLANLGKCLSRVLFLFVFVFVFVFVSVFAFVLALSRIFLYLVVVDLVVDLIVDLGLCNCKDPEKVRTRAPENKVPVDATGPTPSCSGCSGCLIGAIVLVLVLVYDNSSIP
jgi:hypothetical protein